MVNKDKSFVRCIIYILFLLILLVLEYIITGQKIVVGIGNGSCIHDDLAIKVFDIGRYISMISIVLLCILISIFRKKSSKFFVVLSIIFGILIFVVPFGFNIASSNIRNNDICKGDRWDSKYCQKRDGKCVEYIEDISDYE